MEQRREGEMSVTSTSSNTSLSSPIRRFTQRAKRWRREAKRTSGWAGMLYVLPAALILVIFEVWPIFFNIYISLWRWDVGPLNFVGLANYQRLISEGFVTRDYSDQLAVGEVLKSLIVTIYYVLVRVPITIGL